MRFHVAGADEAHLRATTPSRRRTVTERAGVPGPIAAAITSNV
jgi:hypothetical protein